MSQSRLRHPMLVLMDELIRTTSRLNGVFGDLSRDFEVSRMELAVLTAVVESERPPTVPQIGRSLGHPRQVIQRAANQLLERDLIRSEPNPDHKRAVLLVANEAGVLLKEAVDRQALASVEALMQGLDMQECEQLARDLRKLRRGVETYVRQGRSVAESA